jgi:hypothetical protein
MLATDQRNHLAKPGAVQVDQLLTMPSSSTAIPSKIRADAGKSVRSRSAKLR